MKKLNTSNFKNEIKEGVVVIDFFASWCEPCKILAPVFKDISKEMSNKAEFSKIDIDKNRDIAREYNISSVPTVLILKDGKPIDSIVGFLPKDILKSKIENCL